MGPFSRHTSIPYLRTSTFKGESEGGLRTLCVHEQWSRAVGRYGNSGGGSYNNMVGIKFMFYEKVKKRDKIFTVDLTVTK